MCLPVDEYERKQGANMSGNDMSMAGLRWTKAQLKKCGVSEEMQYDDAFTLQKVEPEFVEIFNYMAGMVPFIQKIIKDVSVLICKSKNVCKLLNLDHLILWSG